jgi:hypothetical protein
MMSSSSNLSDVAKNHIKDNFEENLAIKKTIGKYARGLITEFTKMGYLQYNFPDQHYHTANLRKLAKNTTDLTKQVVLYKLIKISLLTRSTV